MSTTIIKKKKGQQTGSHLSGLLDVISPMGIDFQPRSIQNGDLCQRVLVIHAYPPKVEEAWLSKLATLPGVVFSYHVYSSDRHELQKEIDIALGELEGKLINGGNPGAIERVKNEKKLAEELLQKIDAEQQNVANMVCVILIAAADMEQLNNRTKEVEATISGMRMRARTPLFKQEQALKTVGPWGILDPDIKEMGYRNMPVESVAAGYPMVYSGLKDEKGILLGTDKAGGIVLADLWYRGESRTNSNIFLSGKPGVGKSTTVKKIILNEYGQDTNIIMVDPEREYKHMCQKLGGAWIDCGGGTKGRINPLQARDTPQDDDDEDDDDRLISKEIASRGNLAMHFQFLRTFFRLYCHGLQPLDFNYLELALEEVYAEKSIYWETNLDLVGVDDWPIMEHVFIYLEKKRIDEPQKEVWERLAMAIRPIAIGADSHLWNGPTNTNMNSDFVVLDINTLLSADERIMRTQFFNVCSFAWNKINLDRMQQDLLGVDEAYLLADPEVPQPLKWLRNVNKQIRKREGGLMTITQNIADFDDPSVRRYAEALINNPTYKILMGQGDKDLEALAKMMSLSEKEKEALQQGNRGDALLVAGNRRLHVHVEPTPFELELFGKAGGR
ncbi:conjugal transfer protein TraC [Neobacillus pocheonensis]|uniref:VirB4 family type IV secretion system protein n=1 Tax=Neobacillus pocheonensis TaxID=363869 RepID=UPI003D2DFF5C